MKFADIILPLPLAQAYTYSVPDRLEQQVAVGFRVLIPFGKKKIYTGIILRLHEEQPEGCSVKPIMDVLDQHPILLPQQMKLWQWITDYYLCALGDVYKAAVPSGLKPESDSKSSLEEDLHKAFTPRTEVRVRLFQEEELLKSGVFERQVHLWLDGLKRAPKQKEILVRYLELSGLLSSNTTSQERSFATLRMTIGGADQMTRGVVTRKELQEASSAPSGAIKALLDKRILELYEVEIGRLQKNKSQAAIYNKELNKAQSQAMNRILNAFSRQDVCLLHGVTSSGKTEIYIHLIQQVLKAGKQVLYLLPEIALTTQITERLSAVFGDKIGVYHSKYPDSTRVEIWQKQLSDKPYDVILGVRSSVFLPFQRLGLVIIDEEHETSYKQQDPAPRYHARSAALMLAAQAGAKTLLGTATPSLESYYHSISGKYAYVPLTERYAGLELPEIQVVDLTEQRKQKRMNGPFSHVLLSHIQQALENKEQIILFQNRRGFAPMVECKTCGWVPRCQNCDVSLTFHRGMNLLTCHYCGYTYQLPSKCPSCEEENIVNRGYGTERIENLIQQLFPEVRIARMDLDTTRSRSAYERIIGDFQSGKTDILIGTQMVTKGLDFDRVSVVGILDADMMLNYPDFRSYERAFQMMAQVAGRAGRHGKRGKVILQTRSVQLPVINQVVHNDYTALYDTQVAERKQFRYPPFYRMIYVYLKHRKEEAVQYAANRLASQMRQALGEQRVLGPDRPAVARVQQFFIRKVVLKVEPKAQLRVLQQYLKELQRAYMSEDRQLVLYFDVDPS